MRISYLGGPMIRDNWRGEDGRSKNASKIEYHLWTVPKLEGGYQCLKHLVNKYDHCLLVKFSTKKYLPIPYSFAEPFEIIQIFVIICI